MPKLQDLPPVDDFKSEDFMLVKEAGNLRSPDITWGEVKGWRKDSARLEIIKAILVGPEDFNAHARQARLRALLKMVKPDVEPPKANNAQGWEFLKLDLVEYVLDGEFDALDWREAIDG